MSILILEHDHYLGQKIASKLEEEGYNCDVLDSSNDIKKGYDTIIISSSLENENYLDIIKKYNHCTILVLVPFINEETVSVPMDLGASDYLVKPFIMKELIRKVKHFRKCQDMKEQYHTIQAHNEFLFRQTRALTADYSFPLVVHSTATIDADKIAFDIAHKENKKLQAILIKERKDFEDITLTNDTIVYFCGFHNLNSDEQDLFVENMQDQNIILYQDKCNEFNGFKYLSVEDKKVSLQEQDIMTINEYTKHIVLNFQDTIPDTKLSAKLGMSRKSLWEKRKKLGIEKKK